MALPEVTLDILDGAAALAPENIDGISAKVGISSAGTPNTLYSFMKPKDVVDTLGQGPLPESLAHDLEVSGGPKYAMKISGSVAGSNSAVTQVGSGPLVTIAAGAPNDAYEGIARITKGGALGVSTFQVSLDGGDTWSADIATAATYAIPNAATTLEFAAGTYMADTTYSWTGTPNYFNTTDLNTTLDALLANPAEWGFIHVVGRGTAAADSAAMAAALQTKLHAAAQTGAVNLRYVAGCIECADDSDANLISAFASVDTNRVTWAAGFCELISSISGRIYKRPIAWPAMARAAAVSRQARVGIARSLGRVKDGSLPGVRSLYRDEAATPGLDAARFLTARTIVGKAGFFITRSRMGAQLSSDFTRWEYRRVVDKACRLTRNFMVEFLLDDVRTNVNGTIFELDARAIEEGLKAILRENMVLTENVVAVSAIVDRAINVTTTGRVVVDVRIRRRGYLEDIRVTLGFEAPTALAA